MMTIKKDLYNKILKPCGIKYLYNKKNSIYDEVSTIPQKWDLMIPSSIQDILGMHNDTILTYIVNGEESHHHDTTDSNRSKLKESMRGVSSTLYADMVNHINDSIMINSAIHAYLKMPNKSMSTLDVSRIEIYMKRNQSEVESMYMNLIQLLSQKMWEIRSDITEDHRISTSMREYIVSSIKDNPIDVLGIIILLSLFGANDVDPSFYTDFESHYITVDQCYTSCKQGQLPDISVITALMQFISESNIPNQKIEICFDGEWTATMRLK